MNEFIKKYSLTCIVLLTLFAFVLPHGGYTSDIAYFRIWAEYIFKNGLGNIYNGGTDYLPLMHYILKVFGCFSGSVEAISANINYLKLIISLFLFLNGFFIVWIIKTHKDSWDTLLQKITVFYLLNIAVLYNTIVWGQVDAALTCFVFIACYFAFKKRILLSLIFSVLAINFKLQAIVFLPLIGLLILPVIISSFSIKKLLKWMLLPLLLQLVIILPFIISGTLPNLWDVVAGSVGKYPVVSMNAFNIWDLLLFGEDLITLPDSIKFMEISYKNWGLVMFCSASGIALFPIAKHGYLSLVKKINLILPLEKFLIVCTLIPLLFFYFNTQMHERYSDPAFAFLIAFAIYKNKPIVGFVGCLAYFLNLEAVLHSMNLDDYQILIFNRAFISVLFLVTILMLYAELYGLKLKKVKQKIMTQ